MTAATDKLNALGFGRTDIGDDETWSPAETWLGAQYACVLSTLSPVADLTRMGEWAHAHEAIHRCRLALDVLERMVDELVHKPELAAMVRPDAMLAVADKVAGLNSLVAAAIGRQQ